MSTLPQPPDLEPDEDQVTELASVVPPPAEEFTEAVHARLDREALATNVVTMGWSALVNGVVELFGAVLSLLGAAPSNDRKPENEDE